MPKTDEERMLEIKLILNSIAAQRREYDKIEADLVNEYNTYVKQIEERKNAEVKKVVEAQQKASAKKSSK